ncbi:MAG: hypothetical protein INQ03_09425 [Candidatus Heimdallarchaeota archaeon]|nr:hypothetical protein [Candidatus Heimdallarchaeota archaeon]
MKKYISFILKIVGILLIFIGSNQVFLIGEISVEWEYGMSPPGMASSVNGTLFELGLNEFNSYTIEYNEVNESFDFSESDEEVDPEISELLNMIYQVLLAAIALILLGALIHLKKSSKIASFLILIGCVLTGGIVYLIYTLQDQVLNQLPGERQGDVVISPGETTIIDGTSYTWNYSAILHIGDGVNLIIFGVVSVLIALFIRGSYNYKNKIDFDWIDDDDDWDD